MVCNIQNDRMSGSIVEGEDGRTGGIGSSRVGLCTNNSAADQFETKIDHSRNISKKFKKRRIVVYHRNRCCHVFKRKGFHRVWNTSPYS